MCLWLWKFFFEDDVEKFRQVLAAAIHNAAPKNTRSSGGAKSGGLSTSPGALLGSSPTPTSKKRPVDSKSVRNAPLSQKLLSTILLNRAALNWRDAKGVTLLHEIASSPLPSASEFAIAFIEHPLVDLYIQDEESGWTALHRALYFGNITIARALMDRDVRDSVSHSNLGPIQNAGGLIKIKDIEGNSPFDLFAASITTRSIRRASELPLLDGYSEDEEVALGPTGDSDADDESAGFVPAHVKICGDEVFAFGSNKNFTLGFGDEDDRQFPERVHLTRPENLLRRLHQEFAEACDTQLQNREYDQHLPALVEHKPLIIQDVELAKLHSAILTADPEANLYICGFGSGGRLGTGDEITRFGYVNVQGGALAGKKIIDIALGQDHTIAVSSLGETITWGSNLYGQLGYTSGALSSSVKDEKPVQLLPRYVYGPLKRETIIGAAASRIHSVAFTHSALYTFGKNEGQLGIIDSDARSLTTQVAPRRVAAALFSSGIISVSAIDSATICLLQNHEVWVFANYGYTRLNFPTAFLPNYFLEGSSGGAFSRFSPDDAHGHRIAKISAAGDTICALSSAGDVFTVKVSQKAALSSSTGSTTNPAKIREALSAPQRIWSTKKASMAVHDVDVGQDGAVIICTESGSVWRRVNRAKIKEASAPGPSQYRAKDYKFSRVPRLTGVKAVRSNAFGGFAAVRCDSDVLKAQIDTESQNIWKDVLPLLPFDGFGAEDSDTENPMPRFWTSTQGNDVASIRRAVLNSESLEVEMKEYLADRSAQGDIHVGTTLSETYIPLHEFMFAGRSEVFRRAISKFRVEYYFSIPEVLTIEYDKEGRTLVMFQGLDFITLLNLVLYLYTDSVVDVWHHTRLSPPSAFRYRQVRTELMRLASHLEMRKLEHSARGMTEPSKTLHSDMEAAIKDEGFFDSGDFIIQLEGKEVRAHSALLCRRCPFFEGLYEGRAAGIWLSTRREEPQDTIKVDLKHVDPRVFAFVLRYLYADSDEHMFDHVIASELENFLDLILDVLSVANELMLERLSQCCQKLLGGFVNTRNVCQLLNEVAPCSVISFKDAALEYICLNLEDLLENRLLGELDEELMLELDETVRENQMATLPVSKSDLMRTDLLKKYPQLQASKERERKVKLDAVLMHSRLYERENRSVTSARAKTDLLEDFELHPSTRKARRRSSGANSNDARRPSLKAQKSSVELMFEMDESRDLDEEGQKSGQSPGYSRQASTPVNRSPYLSASLRSDDSALLPVSPSESHGLMHNSVDSFTQDQAADEISQSSLDHHVWKSSDVSSPKLDMREIMAQAASSRPSQISLGLASERRSQSGSTPLKISQRERKRQQQQQLQRPEPNDLPVQPPVPQPSQQKSSSPWQKVSNPPGSSSKASLSSTPNEKPPARTSSPMTLRQTVSGRPSETQKAVTPRPSSSKGPPPSSESTSVDGPSTLAGSTRANPAKAKASPKISYAPSPSAKPTIIQSIRHIPKPMDQQTLEQTMPMSEILSQQQVEKQSVKEAVAKRSLQEIQEEQAFQEWWDQESQRAIQEEQEREQAAAAASKNKKSSHGKSSSSHRRGGGGRGGSSSNKSRGKEKESPKEGDVQQESSKSSSSTSRGRSSRGGHHRGRRT